MTTHTTALTRSNTSALSMSLINTGKVVRCRAKSYSKVIAGKNSKGIFWNRLLLALCLLLSSEETQKKDKKFKFIGSIMVGLKQR